jgi:hypothetical protein
MAEEPHNRIITQAAREVLRPLGLRQKGRSRTWLDDRGWWVGLVEFQPFSWSKGSYLNVGVTWLWSPQEDPSWSFSLGYRIDGWWIDFESEEQFRPEALRLAERAAEEVGRFRAMLPDVGAAAEVLVENAEDGRGWPGWDAAVALGLAGRAEAATEMFERVTGSDDDRRFWVHAKAEARRLSQTLLEDEERFTNEVLGLIRRNRAALKLEPAPLRFA